MVKIAVPIALFIVVGVVVLGGFYLLTRMETLRQKTLQKALDKGTELTPAFLDSVGKSVDFDMRDLRRGILLCSFGIALLIFGILAFDLNPDTPVYAFSVFPFILGLAYLLVWKLQHKK